MPYHSQCIHCCLYSFIISDSARGRGQNVQRCRCRVSGVRNKCVNNRAHSPRTCWHQGANLQSYPAIVTCRHGLQYLPSQPHLPARTKNAPRQDNRPNLRRRRSRPEQKGCRSIMTHKGMRDDDNTGQLPRVLTGVSCRVHSLPHTGQLPRALTPALTTGDGLAGLEGSSPSFPVPRSK